MRSFLTVLVVACFSAVGAFAPRTSFMPSHQLAGVSRGSSMMTMNAAERTYIMVGSIMSSSLSQSFHSIVLTLCLSSFPGRRCG